jgi:hypothetical protein
MTDIQFPQTAPEGADPVWFYAVLAAAVVFAGKGRHATTMGDAYTPPQEVLRHAEAYARAMQGRY